MINIPKDYKIIFKSLAGSHLYGTSTPNSDEDIRGVFLCNSNSILGFKDKAEQFEDKNDDQTFWELKKFLQLAINCNPNIVELLFVPEDKWITGTEEWKAIIENKEWFISTKARFTFAGYAHSQYNRILNHRNWLINKKKSKPERKDFGLPEARSLLSQDEIGAFNEILVGALKDIGLCHKLAQQLEEMQETVDYRTLVQNYKNINAEAIKKIIDVSDNFMEALKKEKAYRQAMQEWEAYENWRKNRNPARQILEDKYGYDTKHASHLLRLMTEGEELLMTGKITFPRPDKDLLLEVKNGKYKFDKLIEMVKDYDDKFEKLYKESPLPKKPNIDKVNELCILIYKRII